ncbi:MAG: hypothetical protein PHW65_03625 [Dehalococcoidales bacterium]|nr:hypothetical protein [Dehalococcoidales bacterium]
MKQYALPCSTERVKAFLDNRVSQIRLPLTEKDSMIGEGGLWRKLAFYGKHTWNDEFHCMKEPYTTETFIDHGFPDKSGKYNYGYLHAPYDFEEEGTIFRVYPRLELRAVVWIKEAWDYYGGDEYLYQQIPENVIYRTDSQERLSRVRKWRPSIFMPRWASRLAYEVTCIQPQRLQDISEQEAQAEGFKGRKQFLDWWDGKYDKGYTSTHPYAWLHNCWVWVLSVSPVKRA